MVTQQEQKELRDKVARTLADLKAIAGDESRDAPTRLRAAIEMLRLGLAADWSRLWDDNA